jgi:SAM-dependent methyltransferase
MGPWLGGWPRKSVHRGRSWRPTSIRGFLTEIALPNLELRQHDIRTDPLEPGTYDLAHCRALLTHFPDPLPAVKRMVEGLRIGGWLLVEEPDASSLRAVDAEHPQAEFFSRKVREVFERVSHWSGTNVFFGCRVRSLLEEAGLTDIGNEGRVLIARGGELDARRQGIDFQTLTQLGVMSQAEYTDLQKLYNGPSFSYVTLTAFAAWGKRPS